jgi:hypothetical protein
LFFWRRIAIDLQEPGQQIVRGDLLVGRGRCDGGNDPLQEPVVDFNPAFLVSASETPVVERHHDLVASLIAGEDFDLRVGGLVVEQREERDT